MEKETHIYLADKIHETLMQKFPVNISRSLFREANIKPDQTSQSILHPHFANWSLSYIENQTALLMEEVLCKRESIRKDFIFRLGRITHYLCDFFCQVHIGSQLFRVREHVAYESRLNQVVREQTGYFDNVCRTDLFPSIQADISTRRLYEQCLHQYLQKPASFERDMEAAARISVLVAGRVLHNCLHVTGAVALNLSGSYVY